MTDIVNINKSVTLLYSYKPNSYVKFWQNDKLFHKKTFFYKKKCLIIEIYNAPNMSHRLFPSWRKHGRNPRWQFLPDLNSPIFMLSFIKRSLSLRLVWNLNTLPDEDLYSMSSWESSFMARPIVWLVFL